MKENLKFLDALLCKMAHPGKTGHFFILLVGINSEFEVQPRFVSLLIQVEGFDLVDNHAVVRHPSDDQADCACLVDQVVDAFSGIEFLYRTSSVTDQGVGNTKFTGETLDRVQAVTTDTHDLGIEAFQDRHVPLKSQRCGFSGRGVNGEIKRQDDILFP